MRLLKAFLIKQALIIMVSILSVLRQDPIEDGMLDHNIIGHAVWRIRTFFLRQFWANVNVINQLLSKLETFDIYL